MHLFNELRTALCYRRGSVKPLVKARLCAMSLASGWITGEVDRPGVEGFPGGALVGGRCAGFPTLDAADGGGLGRGFRVFS